jgi:hypothetical protein
MRSRELWLGGFAERLYLVMRAVLIALFAVAPTLSLRVPAPVAAGDALTRRGLVQSAAAAAALVAGAGSASAAEQARRAA